MAQQTINLQRYPKENFPELHGTVMPIFGRILELYNSSLSEYYKNAVANYNKAFSDRRNLEYKWGNAYRTGLAPLSEIARSKGNQLASSIIDELARDKNIAPLLTPAIELKFALSAVETYVAFHSKRNHIFYKFLLDSPEKFKVFSNKVAGELKEI